MTAIYPGSFDPVTNGHLDLIARGSKLFDQLIVAVLRNSAKNPLFTVEERVEMLCEGTAGYANVEVATFEGLLVDFARKRGARAVLRGIRAISDYEYELQMAMMNRRLNPEVETIFLMPDAQYSYVSSRLVKEAARLGGSVHGLVPELVIRRLEARLETRPAVSASAPVAAAAAQLPRATASLTGTIRDATGAVIPGATVTATDPAKSFSRAVMTGPDGRYRIPDLPIAVYKLEAQAPGFLTQTLTAILTPAQPSVADLTLTIGQAAQTVAVQASPALVELQAAPPVTAKIVPQNSPESAAPIFEITTETGEHWTSTDGLVWKRN